MRMRPTIVECRSMQNDARPLLAIATATLLLTTLGAPTQTLPPARSVPGASPAPQLIPAPGPATDHPYVPQAILPGGVVVTIFRPASPPRGRRGSRKARVNNRPAGVPAGV